MQRLQKLREFFTPGERGPAFPDADGGSLCCDFQGAAALDARFLPDIRRDDDAALGVHVSDQCNTHINRPFYSW